MDSAAAIREKLDPDTLSIIDRIDVFDVIDSTNTYLLDADPPDAGRASLALADHQTAGRGRRGSQWLSRPGGSLCLSLSWTFATAPESLPALTLAAGVAVARALDRLGIAGIELKWPNDIVADDAKLGGLLVETVTGRHDRVTVVIGIGINLALDEETLEQSGSSWAERATDLRRFSGNVVDRDTLAAALCRQIIAMLKSFERGELTALLDEWRSRDWLNGSSVTVSTTADPVTGVAEGIDDDGALKLLTAEGLKRITSGSVMRSERA